MNYDDPAFVLAFTVLLPILGLGLAFFVGIRRHDVFPLAISTMAVGVLWAVIGVGVVLGQSPSPALCIFYGVYLMLSPVLLAAFMPRATPVSTRGAHDECRVWAIFVVLWVLVVQLPVASWVLNVVDGWLVAGIGLLDFGGASVLYLSTACAGLAWLLVARSRGPVVAVSTMKRAAVTIALLWVGSSAVTVGSEAVPGGMALPIAINTAVAPVCALVAWVIVERIRHRKVSLNGAVRGVFAGLVAITAAVDVVSPFWAGVLGLVAGALASTLAGPGRQALGLVITQLSAAVLGLLFIGILGEGVGGLLTGNWSQLGAQMFSVVVIAAVSFAVAFVLAFVTTKLSKHQNWHLQREQSVR